MSLIVSITPLTKSDLSVLSTQSSAPVTKKLRANHHAIARLLAAGVRPVEISERLGMSPTTISILQKNPAFQDLLLVYQNEAKEATFDLRERLVVLAKVSTERLLEVLTESEDIDPDFLRKTVTDLLDRTGYPAVRQVNSLTATAKLTSDDIERIKEKYAAEKNGAPGRVSQAQVVEDYSGSVGMGEVVPAFSAFSDEVDSDSSERAGLREKSRNGTRTIG
jgi:hypothetical protein